MLCSQHVQTPCWKHILKSKPNLTTFYYIQKIWAIYEKRLRSQWIDFSELPTNPSYIGNFKEIFWFWEITVWLRNLMIWELPKIVTFATYVKNKSRLNKSKKLLAYREIDDYNEKWPNFGIFYRFCTSFHLLTEVDFSEKSVKRLIRYVW